MTAYVRKITDDGRIDVSLQQEGLDQVKVATEVILELLNQNEGVLDIGDKSSPEQVQLITGMSKKVFKRAAGFLMKKGVIVIDDFSVKVQESPQVNQ